MRLVDTPADLASVLRTPAMLIAKYEHRCPADFDESLEAGVAAVESIFGEAAGFVPFVRTLSADGMRHFDFNAGRSGRWQEALAELGRETGADVVTLARSHIVTGADLGTERRMGDDVIGLATVESLDGNGRHVLAQCCVDIGGEVATRVTDWILAALPCEQRLRHLEDLRPAQRALAENR